MKRRKTRQEKIIADLRKKLENKNPELASSHEHNHTTYSVPQHLLKKKNTPLSKVSPTSQTYTYVFQDLKKITLVTTSLIVAELILYFVLQAKI